CSIVSPAKNSIFSYFSSITIPPKSLLFMSHFSSTLHQPNPLINIHIHQFISPFWFIRQQHPTHIHHIHTFHFILVKLFTFFSPTNDGNKEFNLLHLNNTTLLYHLCLTLFLQPHTLYTYNLP